MPAENRVSFQISDADKTTIRSAVTLIKTTLQPYLISLTPEERHELAKMSDKSVAFVEKCLNYAKTNPEFAPPYLNVNDLGEDVENVKLLTEIDNPLEQIVTGLDDTIMLAGSEAYTASLAYYNSIKQAAKQNIPNAKNIYEDLRARFPQKGNKKNDAGNQEQ